MTNSNFTSRMVRSMSEINPYMSAQLLAIQAEILAAQACVLGMQAENDQRKACGESPAYVEGCFAEEAQGLQHLAEAARALAHDGACPLAERDQLKALNAELADALEEIADYPELDALEIKRIARAALAKQKETT